MTKYHLANIILVDDDIDDRYLFKQALGIVSAQSNLTCFDDCNTALAQLKIASEKPDVIFIDLMMPGVDGYECVTLIKQDPNLKDVPVVALSSLITAERINRLYDLGVSFFITKPPTFEKLKTVIDKMVNTPSMYTTRSRASFHVNQED